MSLFAAMVFHPCSRKVTPPAPLVGSERGASLGGMVRSVRGRSSPRLRTVASHLKGASARGGDALGYLSPCLLSLETGAAADRSIETMGGSRLMQARTTGAGGRSGYGAPLPGGLGYSQPRPSPSVS